LSKIKQGQNRVFARFDIVVVISDIIFNRAITWNRPYSLLPLTPNHDFVFLLVTRHF
jgi:hypothetical protein